MLTDRIEDDFPRSTTGVAEGVAADTPPISEPESLFRAALADQATQYDGVRLVGAWNQFVNGLDAAGINGVRGLSLGARYSREALILAFGQGDGQTVNGFFTIHGKIMEALGTAAWLNQPIPRPK